MTVLGDFLWPTFLFTHITKGYSGYSEYLPQYSELYCLPPVKTMSLHGDLQKSCKLAFVFALCFSLFPKQELPPHFASALTVDGTKPRYCR